MSDWTLQLYHRLPRAARSVAASLHGYRLRSWRYGLDTPQLVSEALERDQWSSERWKNWRQERLAYVLHRAATRVPYYRAQWTERRRQGDRASWELLENWPILEKESLKEQPLAFVANDRRPDRMFPEHTSGTTGKSLDLWWSRETVRAWYGLLEARCRRWNGVCLEDRWAILGGQLVVPIQDRRPPFWVWNKAFNQLYMSSYHLAPKLIPCYLDALQRYEIKYLWGYTSSLYSLAIEALRLKRRDLHMAVAITNAEPICDYQRQTIAEAFQSPVRETYGMAEIVSAASECHEGSLHLWPEVGIVEVVEENQPVSLGASGDLICTGLLNADMPLIRYNVGDRGTLPLENWMCKCGKTLPILASVEGRSDDLLFTSDGRRVGRLDPIFKARLPVREAQIIQDTLTRIRVCYVPDVGFNLEAECSIKKRLQARMGNVEVVLEEVDSIPRTDRGKFRAVICNLPPEQRRILTSSSASLS